MGYRDSANMVALVNQFFRLKAEFEKARITWAIFAGAAAHAYGSTRRITDIDILVKKDDMRKVESVLGLSISNMQTKVDSIDLVFEVGIKTKSKIMRFFMDEEMQKNLRYRRLYELEVPVVPLEDNIILKAALGRGSDQGKFDLQDIIDMKKNSINYEYLKRRIKFYNVEEIVVPILSNLNIL
ncbi:MAG TPA: nucleotidyltransferase [Candidatus Acidoferrum sp.]|nr:nucleotidyltransferase [Candidatus Acidoferrum sp.]